MWIETSNKAFSTEIKEFVVIIVFIITNFFVNHTHERTREITVHALKVDVLIRFENLAKSSVAILL